MANIPSGDGEGGFSLPAKFDPYTGPGTFKPSMGLQDYVSNLRIIDAFVALVTAGITGTITTFFGGVASIQAGITRLVTDPLQAFTSFLNDVVAAVFGAANAATWAPAIGQVSAFGVLSFVAGVAVVAATTYIIVGVARSLGGGGGE